MRMPLLWGAAAFLIGGGFLDGPAWMGPAGLMLLLAGLALYLRVGTVRRPPIEVGAPVTGRWLSVNSPADKVPSHGLRRRVVVRVHGRERDHRSRRSWPSLLYLFAEGSLRELTGPGRVLGNHVVLDLGGGVYAVRVGG
jgi:hypothetical protein